MSWRRNSSSQFYCDDNTIASGNLLDGEGSLVCQRGCVSSLIPMKYVCTNFSADENWSFGMNDVLLNFVNLAGRTVTMGFSGSAWIAPFDLLSWNVGTTFSLTKRNGRINSTPRAIAPPVIRLQEGCNHTFALAVSDPDDDIVRCRWAEGEECGGICDQFPGAELDSYSCSIHYQANRGARYWAAAIMIEDFIPGSGAPLSSVALQFLVLVVNSTSPCIERPEFIPPTVREGSCVAIPPGTTFHTQLTAISGSFNASIIEIQTTLPLGASKGELGHIENTDSYSVNISWTPEASQQNETHQLCFTAVNSHGESSEQTCIQLLPGHCPPMPVQTTASPNRQLVAPSNTTWRIEFDTDIQRPSVTAFITFHKFNTEDEVFRIDTSLSPEVVFEQSNEIVITPSYLFTEKQNFYINFERGIVQNPQSCGPGSEPVKDKNFWTFEIMDVTPPFITLLEYPYYFTNDTDVRVSWESNENVTWHCELYNFTTVLNVSCDEAQWSDNMLDEGHYNLDIFATDEAGNIGYRSAYFAIDLTPPTINITQKPALLSNQRTVTITVLCIDESYLCFVEYKFFSNLNMTAEENFAICHSYYEHCSFVYNVEHNVTYTFSITATDQADNRGETIYYSWETDFENPNITGIQNVSVLCSDVSPNRTGQAEAIDNRSESAAVNLTYGDIHLGCSIRRTWMATDEAGNTASLVQNIGLDFTPTVSLLPQVTFPCDSTATSVQVPTTTASAPNPCGLPLHFTHEDSITEYECPSDFLRTWVVTVCNKHASSSQGIILYDLCPPNACGRNESSPRGVCTFGQCQCNRPWYGVDCSILIYQPRIEAVNDTILQEAQEYTSVVILSQGTAPLSWTLLSGPDQLILDQSHITWSNAVAGNHTVSVRVENQVGTDQVAWTLQVEPGYIAFLSPVSLNTFPRAQPVTLTGHVEYATGNAVEDYLGKIVPVHVTITSNGASRTLRAFTNPDGNFSTIFYPVATEYGTYSAGARHPSSSHSVSQTEWYFLGIKSTPRIIILNGETVSEYQETFYNATIVCNDGPGPLNGIMAIPFLADSEDLQIHLLLQGMASDVTLEPGDEVAMDIEVIASRPLSAVFPILLQTTSGTTLQLTVHLQIEPILPNFLINPQSVSTRVIRGQSRVFEFNVTNTGRGVAHSVQAILPETDLLSFISFGSSQQSEGDFDLENRESATLSILTQIPANQQLGEITATVIIISREVSESIPITLTVSSNILMNLTVIVEDEYTYFATGQPLVNNAAVTLINYQRNLRITETTDLGNGTTTFVDIHEDRYEMFVEAPGHQTLHQIIIASIDTPSLTVFIARQAVMYTWSVTPVSFEDTYTLTLEADFETHVPIPVVTVTPTEIDLEDLELGVVSSIQLNITNHGLIRANAVSIQFPTDHPSLEFTTNTDELGDLEPLSFIIVTVETSRKRVEKRITQVIWAIYLINIAYSYICGDLQLRDIAVALKKPEYHNITVTSVSTIVDIHNPSSQFDDSDDPLPLYPDPELIPTVLELLPLHLLPEFSSFTFMGYSARTPAFCNDCLQSILNCVPQPKFPLAGCIPSLAAGKLGFPWESVSSAIDWVECAGVGTSVSSSTAIPSDGRAGKWLNLFNCFINIYEDCLESVVSTLIKDLLEAMYPIHQSIALGKEVLGDELWLSVGDPNWLHSTLRPVLDDESDASALISDTELSGILEKPFPNGTSSDVVSRLVERLNNTLHSWNNGQLEPQEGFNMASFSTVQELAQEIISYDEIATSKGFSSYIEAYNFAAGEVNKMDEWEEESGVCAIIRIRIEQELAVTREAFLAKLEIENQEDSPLEQIELQIMISDTVTRDEATHLFSIGDGMLSGSLSIVDSTWSLPSEMSGEAEWLIIPYSEAAPVTSRAYDVGGTLFYTLNGRNISIPLLPTKITVIPDPSLLVHYFLEKNAIGDNPLTDEIEPSVPFTLGIAVRNAGYGTASSLQITSGQPEIIENSNGLLVNFMIIGATIGSESITPSLTVTFGNLAPNTTKVARWLIISSLQGEFNNYSATFENINPLGNPKLSILDELEIHELIRNVMIYTSDEEDGILDFLVNEQNDYLEYPDALYSSKTLQRYNVSAGTILSVHTSSSGVEIRTSSNSTGWNYYRYADTQGILNQTASSVNGTKHEGNITVFIPPENSWISKVEDDSRMDAWILHIVDYVETTDEVVFIMNLCSFDCPIAERPFERPAIVNPFVSTTPATTATLVTPTGSDERRPTIVNPLVSTTPATTATLVSPQGSDERRPTIVNPLVSTAPATTATLVTPTGSDERRPTIVNPLVTTAPATIATLVTPPGSDERRPTLVNPLVTTTTTTVPLVTSAVATEERPFESPTIMNPIVSTVAATSAPLATTIMETVTPIDMSSEEKEESGSFAVISVVLPIVGVAIIIILVVLIYLAVRAFKSRQYKVAPK